MRPLSEVDPFVITDVFYCCTLFYCCAIIRHSSSANTTSRARITESASPLPSFLHQPSHRNHLSTSLSPSSSLPNHPYLDTMTTNNFPSSTAVNSNGGCFYHGELTQLDLSTLHFGDLSCFDRARYDTAAADVLLDAAEPAARRRKRKLWFAPDGIGHKQDEHRPGAVRRSCQEDHQPEQSADKADERPNKRACRTACLQS